MIDRMTNEDAERLKIRCKEYFWFWLTTMDSYWLVTYKTHFNLLNKFLDKQEN